LASPAAPTFESPRLSEKDRQHAALAHTQVGFEHLERAQPQRAASRFLEALVLFDLPEAHYGMGLCLVAGQRLEHAHLAFLQAVTLDRSFAEAYAELGVVRHLQGNPHSAARVYRHALALAPNDERTRFNLGLALRDSGQVNAARGQLQRLGKSRLFGASSGVELALLRLRQGAGGAERSARRYLEGALRRDPGCVAALYNLGVLLLRDGEELRGRAELTTVVQAAAPGGLYQTLALAALRKS
jgi:tetratricopeptide (TPR) repeat protein